MEKEAYLEVAPALEPAIAQLTAVITAPQAREAPRPARRRP
jgi:hypothetical protein